METQQQHPAMQHVYDAIRVVRHICIVLYLKEEQITCLLSRFHLHVCTLTGPCLPVHQRLFRCQVHVCLHTRVPTHTWAIVSAPAISSTIHQYCSYSRNGMLCKDDCRNSARSKLSVLATVRYISGFVAYSYTVRCIRCSTLYLPHGAYMARYIWVDLVGSC